MVALLPSNGHHLSLENDVVPNLVLGDDIHSCPTRIVSLENTLNGTIFPQEEIVKISEHVRQGGIIMHLDGGESSVASLAALESLHLVSASPPLERRCRDWRLT